MKKLLPFLLLLSMIGLTGAMLAQEKKLAAPPKQVAEMVVPAKLVLKAKNGNVTYDHAAHAKREKNDCKGCHDTLWPQDAKAPLNYKSAMHKMPEDRKTSCGFCHHEGGKAFAAKGNCTIKCHVKFTAK